MIADLPRKRTCAAALLIGVALGATIGTIDRARGVRPSIDKIFSETPAGHSSRTAGEPCRHPCIPRAGVAAHQEARS